MRVMAWAAVLILLPIFMSSFFLGCSGFKPSPESIRATQTAFMATRTANESVPRELPHPANTPKAVPDKPYSSDDAELWSRYGNGEGYIKCRRDDDDLVKGDQVCYLIERTPFDNATPMAKAVSRPPLTRTSSGDVTVRDATFLCYDVSATYRTFRDLGHEEALDHLQNFLNLETDGRPYIRPSDARNAWEACQP